jgi:uncharacterized protein (TIGR01777 family)
MHAKPRIAILGVTGFIGRALPQLFLEEGMLCTGVSRSGKGDVRAVEAWQTPDTLDLAGHHAVVNLAGESIAQRWNEKRKQLFHQSRIGVTQKVVETIRRLPLEQRPKVLINTSAVGIYGDRADETLTEEAALGSGYLADLCREWEDAALEAEPLGVRVVRLRIGIVLGREGEAFKKLMRVFKLGIGGKLGSGMQWMPWIHVDDLRHAIVHSVLEDSLRGPVNASAPWAERNVDFTRKLASSVHRPAIFPVPGFALKLALGGFGGALLEGQRVRPSALEASGFRFVYPTLESALADLVR